MIGAIVLTALRSIGQRRLIPIFDELTAENAGQLQMASDGKAYFAACGARSVASNFEHSF